VIFITFPKYKVDSHFRSHHQKKTKISRFHFDLPNSFSCRVQTTWIWTSYFGTDVDSDSGVVLPHSSIVILFAIQTLLRIPERRPCQPSVRFLRQSQTPTKQKFSAKFKLIVVHDKAQSSRDLSDSRIPSIAFSCFHTSPVPFTLSKLSEVNFFQPNNRKCVFGGRIRERTEVRVEARTEMA
jgi:hypothetical protein